MTDDLVKRLRERNDLRMLTASMPPLPVKDWLCHAAADRIEKLEAALREIKELHHGPEDEDVSVIDSIFIRDDRTYKIVCDTLEEKDGPITP